MLRARHLGLLLLLTACASSNEGTNRIIGDAALGGSSSSTGGASNSTGGASNSTGGAVSATGGAIGSTGGAIGSTGGAIGSTGGAVGSTGGAIGSTGGAVGSTGGAIGSTGGAVGSTGGAIGSTGGAIGSTGGAIGSTGGAIGSTGGAIGSTGGSTADASVSSDASSDASADVAIPVWFPGSALVDAAQGVMINGWVGPPTNLWKLCYSTAIHARSGQTFHTNCDFKGPSVSIARVSYLTETRVIGGYNSGSWFSPAASTYANNSGSFLFSVTNAFKHSFPGSSTVPYYTLNNQFYGPTFGAGVDWYVHSQLLGGTCAPGYTYQCRTGTSGSSECNTDFCGTPSANESYVLEALEVWVH